MEHHDVFGPDKGPCVSRGHGRNHDLWKSDWKRAHDTCPQGRAHGTAQTDDAVKCLFGVQVLGATNSTGGHTGQGLPFVSQALNLFQALPRGLGHFFPRYGDRIGVLAFYARIHEENLDTGSLHAGLQVAGLLTLGIHRGH